MSTLLGGLGLLGILVALVFGFVVLLVLPWWALLDCAFSRRERGEKVGIIALLVFTWGLGSLVYGAFVTHSRLLRWTTRLTIAGIALVLVPSVAALVTGASIGREARVAERQQEQRAVIHGFQPDAIPRSTVGDFEAVHVVRDGVRSDSAAVARFTRGVLDVATARATDRRVRHVAIDTARHRYWGITMHDFGSIDAVSGRFTPHTVGPDLDFSWPKGLTFDPTTGQVWIMTSHVSTRFYLFEPGTSRWRRLEAEHSDLPLAGLALLDGVLYGVEHRTRALAIDRLRRFSPAGADVGVITLHPPIPVADDTDSGVQLSTAGDMLVLLMPPEPRLAARPAERADARLFVVDPRTGVVRVPE